MPDSDLSILIVCESRLRAHVIESGLREAGHSQIALIDDLNDAARAIQSTLPGAVVIDLENPRPDTLAHFFSLVRAIQRPVAMFVDRSDSAMIEKAVEAGVSAYVVDGLRQDRVKPVLDMAVSRFNAFARLTRELAQARGDLEDRKIIEHAKGILMRTRNLNEADAYALLRSTAMNQNRKMADIAQSLVTTEALLGP